VHRPVGLLGGQRIQLVEEPGGLLVLAGHGAHQQRVPGPGAGHVEQPALLGQQRRRARHRLPTGLGHAGHQVDQPLVAQQAAAQPQVRPAALLHRRHGDHVPLAAAGTVRGEQRDRLPLRRPRGQ
jgi:hypothetical protein